MKQLSDYPQVQIDNLNRFKQELVHMDSTLSNVGSAKLRMSYDIVETPTVRVRFNASFPPVSVMRLMDNHNMSIIYAFVDEEKRLVLQIGQN